MDVLDKFFKKFSYKFPKGYPDPNDIQDMIMLEGILKEIGLNLQETALSPSELNKDATLPGGVKTPRIEILIDIVQNGEELELNDGSKFIVDNKEEVLNQLKGKTSISNAITLIDKDGNKITTSNLKKTTKFGGGGGMRGGSELTAKAESAQCIVNQIRYSSSGNVEISDITDSTIESTKGKVNITDFEGAAELLKTNKGWVESSVSIANELASQFKGSFIQNRGSEWVKSLEAAVKPLLKDVGIKDINKWSPADIWMVAPSEMNVTWPNNLDEINSLLLVKYEEGKIIGVSLKKAGKQATLKVFNSPKSDKTTYEFKGIDPRPNAAKAFILFDDASMEFRTFGGLGSFQGEILGKKAAGGKVGYTIIKKALQDNGIAPPEPKEIKNQVVNEDPEFKKKFQKLWDNTPGLEPGDFETQFDNPKKTPNQNLIYRVSKYLALFVVNSINNSNDPSEIVTDIINYASSSTDKSAIFIKAS